MMRLGESWQRTLNQPVPICVDLLRQLEGVRKVEEIHSQMSVLINLLLDGSLSQRVGEVDEALSVLRFYLPAFVSVRAYYMFEMQVTAKAKESPCRNCGRTCDAGVRACWWCELPDPTGRP